MTKRLFDIFASLLGLIVFSPILAVICVAIKLESPGPIFYRGSRIGRRGNPFRIFKFRSMVVNAETLGASSTSLDDPRITRVGTIVRRLKLDELPQLINVLIGDMSFVGPRPEVKRFVDQYTDEEKKILTVRPGITDWASIRFHNEGEILAASGIADPDEAYAVLIRPEKLRLQLAYVASHSFLTDLEIILATIHTVLAKHERLSPPAVHISKDTMTEGS